MSAKRLEPLLRWILMKYADTQQKSPQLLDVAAVAKMLSCSTRHVYRLVDSGKMPAPKRLGRLVRWEQGELQEWIADGCQPMPRVR